MKKTVFLAFCLTLLLALTGCGASASGDTAQKSAAVNEVADAAAAAGGTEEYGWTESTAAEAPAEVAVEEERISQDSVNYESTLKIIRTGSLSIESDTFDETDAFIRQTVDTYGGILAESSISGTAGSRWASYTVRVPSGAFDQFFYAVSGNCTVTNQTITAEDVTEQYTDLSTQLETNRKKYSRLLELMDQAETLPDLYSIESEIASVEYEIDRITGILNGMDSRIAFSTVYIDVQETAKVSAIPEQPSFGASLSAALKNGANSTLLGLQSLTLFIAYHWFFWLCFLVLLAAALLVLRRIRRKKRAGKQSPMQSSARDANFQERTPDHTDSSEDSGTNI